MAPVFLFPFDAAAALAVGVPDVKCARQPKRNQSAYAYNSHSFKQAGGH